MKRAALPTMLACGLLALAACSPPPRAVGYFKAHPGEDARVVADCVAGTRCGECSNAQRAAEQIKSDQRLSLYKRSF